MALAGVEQLQVLSRVLYPYTFLFIMVILTEVRDGELDVIHLGSNLHRKVGARDRLPI